ncbi:hypothetical protein BN8_03688 [Fibrisoma limi BUZ 3]|uniref:Uncharacterized protein n=1 Tax=Fibrisoma limi BUZ 3 TaxID=1185876 RepID=I2GKT4_9BACT|nr:hypothetical protein [Fibrisoma limi]CCH54510.1 hypothetical protein BN8_03688 [Fibrisoma limi BUZ 3]
MTLDRIGLLFVSSQGLSTPEKNRYRQVLTACIRSAKHSLELTSFGHHRSLTSEFARFTIDQVIRWLPTYIGSPSHPRLKPLYHIYEVIAALNDLEAEFDFIADPDGDYESIRLTDTLFREIAREWAYSKGAQPFRIDGQLHQQIIYAPTIDLARAIYERRLAMRGKEMING